MAVACQPGSGKLLLYGWLLFSTCLLGAQSLRPLPDPRPILSERIANYSMDVRLDVEKRLIHGQEVLTWINPTRHKTAELQFHLYYNAWLNDRSSFLQTSTRRRLDLRTYGPEDWAYCQVQSIGLLNEQGIVVADLLHSMEYIQPDDGNPEDRTVMRVTLPDTVGPGDTIRVRIEWISKVPRTFARTGVRGDYYFIAQWFPKIGVFEPSGTWNCHQFIQTEFYADYGVYDVRLTVPTGWVVGASGKEINRVDNPDGTTTHTYLAADVHDFAWTTSPHYREFRETFSEPHLPEVNMRLLLMPDHLDKKDRYFEATRQALKYYGSWFGPYPYDHITIVDPAYGSGAGGMEYPTLFTGGTRWLSPPGTRSPESVTVHEAGHQFWYGIIGNNEFEHAWLDEGFNTYSQARVMSVLGWNRPFVERYFRGFVPVVFPELVRNYRFDWGDNYDGLRSPLKRDPLARPAYAGHPRAYRINAYYKPTLLLRTLEKYFGWETMQNILSTYFQRWQFRHPVPENFFQVVEEVSGQDMDWFFEQTYHRAVVFDYAVDRVTSKPVRPARGYVEKDGQLVYQEGMEAEDTTDQKKPMFASTVYIARWGEGIFPIEIQMTFADGEQVRERWDGRERWIRYKYLRPARLIKVEVDPERVLALDVNSVNNSWVANPPKKLAAWKWTSKWMLWVQHVLESFLFFI